MRLYGGLYHADDAFFAKRSYGLAKFSNAFNACGFQALVLMCTDFMRQPHLLVRPMLIVEAAHEG